MTANGCGVHGRWKGGCVACRDLARSYERKRRQAKRNGTWKPQVPQPEVLAHLEKLLADGANLAGIAQASGLPLRTLQGIKARTWVQGPTAAALLAVRRAPALLPSGMTSAFGAQRRLQALTALGWSLSEQARRLGMHLQQVQPIAAGKQTVIAESTDAAVRTLFEQLCATPGSSVRARNDAKRKGWLPPLAWDDLDDPQADPSLGDGADDEVDEVAVERALSGDEIELTTAELVVALRVGTGRGETLSHLSARLGLNYWGARRMLGGELTPRREKQARVEAEVLRSSAGDYVIAAQLGVTRSTVSRARARLAASGALVAA